MFEIYKVTVTVEAEVSGSGEVTEFIAAVTAKVRAGLNEPERVSGFTVRNPFITEVHARKGA